MSTQTPSGVINTNALNPGFPIVGGDTAGTNLVIRSTNSNQKGTVIFDETTPSFSSNTGAIQTLGGIGAQHNVSVGGQFMNMPYGYSVNNVLVAPTLGGDYRGYYNLVGTTSVSWSGGVVTMSFQSQNAPPFVVGQFIYVVGVTPTAYNGTWQISACTTTSVSWIYGTSSPGALSAYGYMYQYYQGMQQPNAILSAPQLSGGVPAQVSLSMNNVVLNVIATVSGSGTVANIPFATQSLPPFVVGQQIYVSNVTPVGYNGYYTVTACTTSSVSYANSTTGAVGFVTGAGTISSGYIVGTTMLNPGTGYTSVPTVTISEPVPNTFMQFYQAANGFMSAGIPQSFALNSASGTGAISLGSSTSLSAVSSGIVVTVVSTSGFYTGQPVIISGLSGGANGGLTNGTWYFISTGAGGNCNLASSYQNAVWGLAYTFTAASGLGATMTPTLPSYVAAGFITLGFSSLSGNININPFYPGQQVVVSGSTNSGTFPQAYNGTWTVIFCTTTSVTINGTTQGSLTVNGIISAAPNNTNQIYIKAPTSGGIFNIYQVSYPGYLGSSAPTHTYGTVLNGTAGLTYVGQTATAYASIGYSGVVTQGAIHQVGCVNQIIITNAGAGYGNAPQIILGRPDIVGGRQALAVCSISSNAIQYVTIIDAGSGYLNPPTVTFVSNAGAAPTTVATGTAVIGNPGEKPIVSALVPSVTTGTSANTYSLDFGLTGHNVVFLATASSSTFYFDNLIGSGATPYTKGFPLGRRVILYVKNTNNASITLTFSNLAANNTGTSTNTVTLTANKTCKCEFIVLSQGNLVVPGTSYTAVASYAGGSANDVYATFTLT